MGEVYQAHDTKLGRDVAIKVLPEAFAHDPERLSRFQREAKMLAALNHPNIATIYGLEQSNGTSYLVMELVSGETLARARQARRGGSNRRSSGDREADRRSARSRARERHHSPRSEACQREGDAGRQSQSVGLRLGEGVRGRHRRRAILRNSPTLSCAATMQGVILGTAAYMSPEQARGKAVDKRTDIWAFGCVLYELLTGKQAFHGEDVTEILAAVVRAEPDWQALPAATPVKIRDLLRRCLQKDKTLRLRDAGDARIEIQEALAAPIVGPTAIVPAKRGWRQVVVLGVAALLAAAIGGLAVWNLKPTPSPPPQPVSRFTITLPPGDHLAAADYPAIAISADGKELAYAAIRGGVRQIFLRALDNLEERPIAGTEGANTPVFSPDGQWLGFFAGGKLKKVSMSGGTAMVVGEAASPNGASWSNQGTIAFSPTNVAPIQQMPDAGSNATPLSHFEKGENSHRWPEFLPDGKTVLFAAGLTVGNWTNVEIAVQPPGTGGRRNLVPGTAPHYAASGHLVYAQGGGLMAVPFDSQRLAVTGAAVPVLEGVLQSASNGFAQFSLSATGSLVYVPGRVQAAQRRLVWVSRNGEEKPLAAPARAYASPRVSPDGQRIAVGSGRTSVALRPRPR